MGADFVNGGSERTASLAKWDLKDRTMFFQQKKLVSQGRGNSSATADELSLTKSSPTSSVFENPLRQQCDFLNGGESCLEWHDVWDSKPFSRFFRAKGE